MTLSEFKAWFDGFCENVKGVPNAKQWARIQERVAEIDEKPVTPVVIERWVDRYIRPYMPPVTPYWISTSGGTYGISPNGTATKLLSSMGSAESASLTS